MQYANFITPECAGYIMQEDTSSGQVFPRIFYQGKVFGTPTTPDHALFSRSNLREFRVQGVQPKCSWDLIFRKPNAHEDHANVTGTVTVGGNVLAVEGSGRVESAAEFERPDETGLAHAQYHEKELAFFYRPSGARVWFRGEPLVLRDAVVESSPDSLSILTRDYEVAVAVQTLQHDVVPVFSSPPRYTLSQELVRYRGVLRHQGKLLHTFSGLGFQERVMKNYGTAQI